MAYAPYSPRKCTFLGWLSAGTWRLKLYAIAADGEAVNPAMYGVDGKTQPMADLIARLPDAKPASGTPGVGFALMHEGATARYLVGAWWINENELASKVWVNLKDRNTAWVPADDAFSFCVWDLEVFWHERNAYVATFMHGQSDADGYLGRTYAG